MKPKKRGSLRNGNTKKKKKIPNTIQNNIKNKILNRVAVSLNCSTILFSKNANVGKKYMKFTINKRNFV